MAAFRIVSRNDPNVPYPRTWREIPQPVKPRAMSSGGKRRLLRSALKSTGLAALLAALGWGGIELAAMLQGSPKTISRAAESVPLKDIVLTTDGVLDRAWIVRTLALPKEATLVGLDLYQLRARLLASGQVRLATLTRNFPSTLSVSLSERSPIVRVMAQIGAAKPRMLLVARDGTVFEGVDFDPHMIETLPWLDGITLTRSGDTFTPVAGMETVSVLLAKAKLEAEHLYRDWEVVSLERLESDHEIEVRAKRIDKIVFSTREDYFRQLARLDSLLDAARAHTDAPIRVVNLAIGAQVPVAFADPALTPASAVPRPKPTPFSLPAFPNLQNPSKL
jgi:cell division protein FtsQ